MRNEVDGFSRHNFALCEAVIIVFYETQSALPKHKQ